MEAAALFSFIKSIIPFFAKQRKKFNLIHEKIEWIKLYYNSISRQWSKSSKAKKLMELMKSMESIELELLFANWGLRPQRQTNQPSFLFLMGNEELICFVLCLWPPKRMNEWNGVVLFVLLVGYGRCQRQGLRQKEDKQQQQLHWMVSFLRRVVCEWRNKWN